MKILLTGSSGLIGTALIRSWEKQGHKVASLVRSHDLLGDDTAFWEPYGDTVDIPKLNWIAGDEGFGAVVHLAGENVGNSRWTPERMEEIKGSRVKGTRLLSESVGKLDKLPRVLVSASATGFYGNRGSEFLNEDSVVGTGFLAEMTQAWEAATSPAREAGIRIVTPRIGVVLSNRGGLLKKVLPLFKIGAGAPLGEGEQYMSWIAINDLVRAFNHVIANDKLVGPVNFTSPTAVTNQDFTRSLGYHFKAPVFLHAPEFLLKALFGDMAEEMLLVSTRVIPVKLMQSGFKFRHTTLEDALNHVLTTGI